jgi:hypothetical protein
MKVVVLTVRRQCLVCEWIGECDEPEGADAIGRECESCHAPTERLEVLNRRSTILPRNPHAAALGRLGGLKGGRARAAVLSPQKRREIARHAARERWRKGVV